MLPRVSEPLWFEFEKLCHFTLNWNLNISRVADDWLMLLSFLWRALLPSSSIMYCVSHFISRWFKCPLCIIKRSQWHTQSWFVSPSVGGPANACHSRELKASQLFNLLLWSAGSAADISCLSHSWYSPSGPCSQTRTVINHLSLFQHKCSCALCTMFVLLTAI